MVRHLSVLDLRPQHSTTFTTSKCQICNPTAQASRDLEPSNGSNCSGLCGLDDPHRSQITDCWWFIPVQSSHCQPVNGLHNGLQASCQWMPMRCYHCVIRLNFSLIMLTTLLEQNPCCSKCFHNCIHLQHPISTITSRRKLCQTSQCRELKICLNCSPEASLSLWPSWLCL